MIEEYNVDQKAECGQLNLAHETKTKKRQCPLSSVKVQDLYYLHSIIVITLYNRSWNESWHAFHVDLRILGSQESVSHRWIETTTLGGNRVSNFVWRARENESIIIIVIGSRKRSRDIQLFGGAERTRQWLTTDWLAVENGGMQSKIKFKTARRLWAVKEN